MNSEELKQKGIGVMQKGDYVFLGICLLLLLSAVIMNV